MNTIRYGSVCSGIEAATCAWHPLGWRPAWFSEIEAFPKAVLAHHYPTVPDYGDMTTLPALILAGEVEAPDLFVGGTPCQSFSVAGMRRGLSDPRGQLSRTYVEILDAIDAVRIASGRKPAIAIWENVPGVLNDDDNAFGNLLAALVGEDRPLDPPGGRWSDAGCVLGPTRRAAWRVLDAQYFGLAQRRRRVFLIVGSPSCGVDPVEVLLVEPGVRRDSPPSREARQGPPATPGGGPAAGRGGRGAGRGGGGRRGPDGGRGVASSHWDGSPVQAFNTGAIGYSNQEIFGQGGAGSERPISPCPTQSEHKGKTLVYEGGSPPVAVPYDLFMVTEPRNRQNRDENSPCHTLARDNAAHAAVVLDAGREVSPTLTASNDPSRSPQSSEVTQQVAAVHAATMAVRRLTPVECERLQGFPDDHTCIPWKGRPAEECPDGARYRALGNSMAVPVVAWVGRRIDDVRAGTAPRLDQVSAELPADALDLFSL